jgi:hypothetical protein
VEEIGSLLAALSLKRHWFLTMAIKITSTSRNAFPGDISWPPASSHHSPQQSLIRKSSQQPLLNCIFSSQPSGPGLFGGFLIQPPRDYSLAYADACSHFVIASLTREMH